jgi:RHS repeat-associated protein
VIEGFSDDYFVVEADASSYFFAHIWVRYQDPNNGYLVQFKGVIDLGVYRVQNGVYTSLGGYSNPGAGTIRVRVYDDSGTDKIAVYKDGNLKLTVSDSAIPYGGVAFGGTNTPEYDDVKIGYDNNGDGDIADAGDDIVWDEGFASTSKTVSHDHAGNLIDDGTFRYVYDAWNRLVKVQASEDGGAATIQTDKFFGTGQRAKKVVTHSGDHDGTVVYLYDGQKIIETRDGSENLFQQFIHGTQYIDELVMVRVKDKGDLYVHQDANWNVIGLTDLGGSLVERHVYRPYGEMIVHQETGYGDYDGDGDVDATDRAAIETGGVCLSGSPPTACRKMDFDRDGDYDSDDRDMFDALPQGLARHRGRVATNVGQPFGHKGLILDAEIGSYQNRSRQYAAPERRFMQRDPLVWGNRPRGGYQDGMNVYAYVGCSPTARMDPTGMCNVGWFVPGGECGSSKPLLGCVVCDGNNGYECCACTEVDPNGYCVDAQYCDSIIPDHSNPVAGCISEHERGHVKYACPGSCDGRTWAQEPKDCPCWDDLAHCQIYRETIICLITWSVLYCTGSFHEHCLWAWDTRMHIEEHQLQFHCLRAWWCACVPVW